MIRNVAVTLVVGFVCACNSGAKSNGSATDSNEIRRAIEAANSKIVAWTAAGQADSAAMLFAEDVHQYPPNMPAVVGRDSLRAFWTHNVRDGKWQFDLHTDDVIAADSIAVERGHYTLKVTPVPGAQLPPIDDHGNYVAAWRRDSDGQWRVLWDAPVSTIVLAPPPPSKKK